MSQDVPQDKKTRYKTPTSFIMLLPSNFASNSTNVRPPYKFRSREKTHQDLLIFGDKQTQLTSSLVYVASLMYEANVTALPVHTRAKNNPLFTPIRHAFSVGGHSLTTLLVDKTRQVGGTANVNDMQIFSYKSKGIPSPMSTSQEVEVKIWSTYLKNDPQCSGRSSQTYTK